jgi:hypothetical protein
MVEKLSAIDTIAQFATDEHYGNGRWSTSIGFTMQQPPTRDPAANRAVAVIIAGELGIMLDDERFTVKDNLAYACMPECNHENDPIDQKPSAI